MFYHFSSEEKTFFFIASVKVDRFVIEILRRNLHFFNFICFHLFPFPWQQLPMHKE